MSQIFLSIGVVLTIFATVITTKTLLELESKVMENSQFSGFQLSVSGASAAISSRVPSKYPLNHIGCQSVMKRKQIQKVLIYITLYDIFSFSPHIHETGVGSYLQPHFRMEKQPRLPWKNIRHRISLQTKGTLTPS
jgi:hypothetical protein